MGATVSGDSVALLLLYNGESPDSIAQCRTGRASHYYQVGMEAQDPHPVSSDMLREGRSITTGLITNSLLKLLTPSQ